MKLSRAVRIKQRIHLHQSQAAAREAERIRSIGFILRLRAAFRKLYA